VILPYNTAADKILKLQLKGLIISSGPEDDLGIEEVLPTLKSLVGKIPLLGIALGSQLIARSLGAKIKKMHLGHHGVNYPIKSAGSLKGEITVQNHSRVVDLDSLKKIKDIQITAVHLNDGTVEGFESRKKKIMAVQYLPASPGFAEINSVLTRFLHFMKGN
jgi:carbamoyl-phosphate synthase small subunit